MQENHTCKNSSYLTFLYTIMLGDSSATPLVPCPLLLVCAMIRWVSVPQEMSGAPVVDRSRRYGPSIIKNMNMILPSTRRQSFKYPVVGIVFHPNRLFFFYTEQMCGPSKLATCIAHTFHKVLTRTRLIILKIFQWILILTSFLSMEKVVKLEKQLWAPITSLLFWE